MDDQTKQVKATHTTGPGVMTKIQIETWQKKSMQAKKRWIDTIKDNLSMLNINRSRWREFAQEKRDKRTRSKITRGKDERKGNAKLNQVSRRR